MKVLYIHQHFSTTKGATGTRSYEFAKRLVKEGHQVTMICGAFDMALTHDQKEKKHTHREIIDGIEVIQISILYSNYQGFIGRASAFLGFAVAATIITLKSDYDVIFATSTPLTAAIPGIIQKIIRRKPFVFEVRDLWPELPIAMGVLKNRFVIFLLTVLEKLSYKLADQVIGLSPGMVEAIQKSKPSSKVHLLPNGCDLELFKPTKVQDTKKFWGVSDSDFVCIYTGAHGIANGLDKLLETAKEVKRKGHHNIKFFLVGNGALKPQLVVKAKAEQLDNCIFLDPISKDELALKLPHCHLGLMVLKNVPAFYYGTSPNKFFDYIASGIPVITNYPGWLANMIAEYKCGVTVPPDDVCLFADEIIRLSEERSSLPQMGSDGRELAEKSFGREAFSQEFVKILENSLPTK